MGKVLGVIPARLESRRLPRKLLRALCGRPMLAWVYERARQASSLDALLVATDSKEIFDVCRSHDIPAVMTSGAHRSGSDRLVEVMMRGLMSANRDDVYVNIQGDEPMISPEHIELLVSPFRATGSEIETRVSTLKVAMGKQDASSPDIVKVVTDVRGRALYFSRAPIPHDRDDRGRARYYKHLGLYAYTVEALEKFRALPPSELELTEKLEQLRFLEGGVPITVIETSTDTIGVDTEEDLRKVEEYFRRLGEAGGRLP
jgi:3-deoxy-manno-octulosonate cytidylyltransferase (CMP-KDO synthetase)